MFFTIYIKPVQITDIVWLSYLVIGSWSLGIKAIVYLLGTCCMVDILFYNKGKKAQDCDLISDKSQ